MTLFTAQGSAIAGKKLLLQTRKGVSINTPKKVDGIGVTYTFRMGQNSEAVINEELAPKQCEHDPNAALNLGDMLRAASISGFSTKPLPAFTLVQATQNHKGVETKCKNFGYAKIDTPIRNELERKTESDNVLPEGKS